ncbi:hypothetical protein NW762_013892 [Fusarium torreyae]|uniref:Uncharacterized protein n=1 Tax=Fusarium torreyae TaxID=1237075 RepID=A0A9W8V8A4_9HYPO|nr:hypothetical protein NW762_013892 [Fusarium torreyae]
MGLSRQAVAGNLNPHCDATCQQAYRQEASEAASWVNINIATDSFYQNPSNISHYEPGDLVKWEDVSQDEAAQLWNILAGMSLSRFLYLSQDTNGKPIPATAFTLLPYNIPNAQDKPLPQQVYAVIAPDYLGQGSDIPQGFMYESGALHAHDTSFAIQAARRALGSALSHEWIVAGHSESGLTAWRTNEREADFKRAIGGSIGAALFNNLTEAELFKNTAWLSHPTVVDWQKRYNGAGPHPLAAPMLVVQGEADILTYPELAE